MDLEYSYSTTSNIIWESVILIRPYSEYNITNRRLNNPTDTMPKDIFQVNYFLPYRTSYYIFHLQRREWILLIQKRKGRFPSPSPKKKTALISSRETKMFTLQFVIDNLLYRNLIWVLRFKPQSDPESDRIFEISNLTSSYSCTMFNYFVKFWANWRRESQI